MTSSRRANKAAVAVSRRRLFHSTGIGRLSTELILIILGARTNGVFLLKVRGSSCELRRVATMNSLWARHWGAIDAATRAEAQSEVPASVSKVLIHSPLSCPTLVL